MESIRLKKERQDDLESGVQLLSPQEQGASPPASPSVAAEYRTSTYTKLLYLAGYFFCNISLTLYNKFILGKVCRVFAPCGPVYCKLFDTDAVCLCSSRTHGCLQRSTPARRRWGVTDCW